MRDNQGEVLILIVARQSDIENLFDIEFADIKRMVAPGARKRIEAKARLRSMAILQASLDGKKSQPSDDELDKAVNRINSGEGWRELFPGVAMLKIVPDPGARGLSLRITKKDGEGVHLVPEGTPGATVVAVKRVNDLDFYSLGLKELAKKLGASSTRLLWFIRREDVQKNEDYFKEFKIGATKHRRYSVKCLDMLHQKLETVDLNDLWLNRDKRLHKEDIEPVSRSVAL